MFSYIQDTYSNRYISISIDATDMGPRLTSSSTLVKFNSPALTDMVCMHYLNYLAAEAALDISYGTITHTGTIYYSIVSSIFC